ncbi:hypothetical protein F2P81_013261 [Scophthalmus maximus]|uniref:Uncharacterized protein n=1 Tax=Scophthalmus maximus TaxID=52904 RepID=A0A6A4SNE5_SCOMX|nr:hypothetical protein F2P81_013261 [Scophthalmus maximus]
MVCTGSLQPVVTIKYVGDNPVLTKGGMAAENKPGWRCNIFVQHLMIHEEKTFRFIFVRPSPNFTLLLPFRQPIGWGKTHRPGSKEEGGEACLGPSLSPELYYMSDPDYHSSDRKAHSWQQIGRTLNAVDECCAFLYIQYSVRAGILQLVLMKKTMSDK